MALQVGDAAPPLPDYAYTDKWTLVYFYPADFTPGCTAEACSFRDHYSELSAHLTLIGVSPDSAESHAKFQSNHSLPFRLIADPDRKLISTFGADGLIFTKRSLFLINPQGHIEKIYNKVDPKTHAAQVLKDLTAV